MSTLEEYFKTMQLQPRADDNECVCSKKHVPDPQFVLSLDREGKNLHLCPTAAINLVSLLSKYEAVSGKPSGSVTKHYGKFVRQVADAIWKERILMSA